VYLRLLAVMERAETQPTEASQVAKSIFWWINAEHHWRWSAGDLIISIVVVRTSQQQHMCLDKGYDSRDIHEMITAAGYIKHIRHRRRRNEPLEPELAPEDRTYPARRWVVERTLGWLNKRRSIRTRWCKKPENWLAFLQFACATVLHDLAIFG